MHNLRVRVLLHAVILEAIFQVLFDLKWQPVLQQAGDLLAVMAMSVADGEKVTVTQVEHMRIGQVGILVDLIWIVSCDASLRCEGELGDNVVN